MDRESKKQTITFRLVDCSSGEIIFELTKEYDLFFKMDCSILHSQLDKFFEYVCKMDKITSYELQFISHLKDNSKELNIPF